MWESLLDEDDNISEVHYHLALAYRGFNSQVARDCAQRAKQVSIYIYISIYIDISIPFEISQQSLYRGE